MSQEISGRDRRKEARLEKALQRMIYHNEDDFELFNKEYAQYKKNYIKNLQYDPEKPDLSKLNILSTYFL